MKRTKTINVIFAPGAWGLDGATRRAAIMLLVTMLTTMTTVTAWAQEAIGAIQYNSSTGYYEINTTDKLKDLAVYVNGSGDYSTGGSETTNHECQNLKFRLTDDLNFGGGSEYTSNFTPIGARSKWFQGEFDGNGKTISGVRVYRSGKDETNDCYIGIFGQTYDGANIHDLTVNDAVFTGFHYVGGIAGHFYGGSLTRCTVTSSVYVKGRNTYSYTHGGITGDNNGTLTNCVSSATLSNGGCQMCLYYGGIAGRSTNTITGCLAVGVSVPDVFGSDQYNDTYGAICGGYSGDNYSFSGNYYRDCKLNGTATASGFGLKGADVSGQAEPGIIVSGIPTNVTVSPVALSYGGHDYYGANSVLTFGTGADNKVFSTFTATGATASSLAADKKTATVTLGSSDVTLAISATLQTISGTTKDGLTWNLAQDADGNYTELTIDGTGPMQNYQYTTDNSLWRTDAPWGWQTLTKVTVGDGVTRIGEFAFIGAQNLASVTIGSGVTEIAKGAINHCDAMTTITLPAVTTVGSGAFENCMQLQTVNFGHDNAVTLDTSNAFNAPELQTINFPSLAGAAANYATTGNWSGYSDKLRPLSRLTIGEGVAVTSDVIPEGGATYVHPGQTVTFSVSSGFVIPEGYTFSGVCYTPEGGQATAATDQGNGSYSFTVPAANVSASAVLRSDGLSHSVTYMKADGTTDTHDAIALDGTEYYLGQNNQETWYFIGKDISYTGTVSLHGSTTIILKDGCTMSIGEDADGKRINSIGINGNTNYALTIYGQSLDDATAGHLKIFTTDFLGYCISYSPYTQHSGNVTVKATGDWAIYSYGDITVNGGTLSATSLTNEAVFANDGGDIIINGGKVNATSSKYSALWSKYGDVTINGGQVEATGNSYGIWAGEGTITLGWTNATDYIKASSYEGTVKVADGKRLAYTDGDNVLHVLGGESETTLTADEIAAIAGKTLRPMLTGSGTTDDLYLISNATDWDVFCDLLEENNQGFFTGKTVVLDNDIAVTRMAGSTNHEFSGIFDGQKHTLTVAITGTVQGTAPFCEIKGATIRNLAVTGSVAGKRHSAGLVGFARGDNSVTNTIENCLVNTSVSITGDTNGYLGGIVGHGFTSALTIRGCAFTGSLTSTSNYTGGLQGWSDGNILTLQNDLFAPTSVSAANAGFHPVAFHNNNSTTTATVSNVYYTVAPTCTQASRIATANAAEQPKQQRNITAGENVTVSNIALTGDATEYTVSGITAYSGGGLQRGETLYYGIDDNVSLTLSNTATGAPDGYQYGYTTNAGTLEGSTLTMPDEDVTISVNTDDLVAIDWATVSTGADKDNAYMIYNKDQLDLLAHRVNGTHGETCQTDGYSGKYFKLGKDIKYTHKADGEEGADIESNYEAIGGYYNDSYRSFRGHFDGNNNTISGIRIYKNGTGYADYYQGIFGQTDGADIHDLTLADARITGYKNTGGIVGDNDGTVTGCQVAADVAVCAVQSDARFHGGIAGNNFGTIELCTSAATLTIADAGKSSSYGGIAGINRSTLRDNLAIGASVPAAANNLYGAITGENDGGTLQRNYYTACKVADTENATGVGCGYIGNGNGGYTTADVTANDGAVSIHTLTLADGITTTTAATVTIGTTGYYAQGTTIALSYSGTIGDGYQLAIVSNDGNGSNAATADGSGNYTAVMPAANATATDHAPIDWATVSTGADKDNAYMIYNKDQLLLLAHRVNGTHGETRQEDGFSGKYFKLGADIDFTSADMAFDGGHSNYEAIGGYYNNTDCYFRGHFDGNNKTVKGIRINKNGDGYDSYADNNQGLFGMTQVASIHDVRLTDARITGYHIVGGIVGSKVYGTVSNCTVTESDITATLNDCYGIIFGFGNLDALTNNYYHGCTVNGNAVTSGAGCKGADVTANNGAVPAYHLALGENITTPPGTFVGQTEWLDTPPVDARLAPENGFTLAGNHYFASGYEFTPGSTLASGAAQGYTLRATLGGQLLDPYTPTGDADPLDGKAIALLTITADCDGKTLAAALRSDGQPHDITYIKADGTTGEASAIALDGTEYYLGQNNQKTWYFVGLPTVAFDHTLDLSGDVNLILADGCTMNVTSSDGNGIVVNDGSSLTIYGQTDGTGTLNATGLFDGIYTDSGNITISGGRVTVTGDDAGILTDSGNITISGGRVTATGTYGITTNSGTITLGCTTDTDFIYASSYFVGSGDRLNIADGQTLYDEDGKFYYGTLPFFEDFPNGKTLRPLPNVLALYDSEDNSEAISGSNGQQRNVILYGRTLSKSGEWNTLCLPFDLGDTEAPAGHSFDGTPLEGATVKELDITGTYSGHKTGLDGTTLYLYFKDATSIVAGKPYIVKWQGASGSVSDPVFSGVTVSSTAPTAVNFTGGSFVGQYSPFSIVKSGASGDDQGNLNEIIMLGTGNKLGYSKSARTLRSFRAHFEIPTNGGTPGARAFVLNFDDENTTEIISPAEIKEITDCNATLSKREMAGAWYSLDGRKLDAKPTKKGLYIHNGNKVVIK